jgi:NADH-quinone oxidoreductase subunit C
VELTRLYPKWFTSQLVSPQVWSYTLAPTLVLRVLARSLLHNGYLFDLYGTHYPGRQGLSGVQVCWIVSSYTRNTKWWVVSFAEEILSSTSWWPSALWLERELWEMFGTRVEGHPDLRRLLTDYGFVGYPLRKDFPVTGYLELRYSEKNKRVISCPVRFAQEFRVFDFVSPWQS